MMPYPFAGARLTQPATPGQGSPLRSDERLTIASSSGSHLLKLKSLYLQQTIAFVGGTVFQTGMNTPAVIVPHELDHYFIGFDVRTEFVS